MSLAHNIEFSQQPFGRYTRLDWRNNQAEDDIGFVLVDEGHAPEFYIVRDADDNEIAASDPWRIQRYLYRGIAHRIETLCNGYLRIAGAEIEVGTGDLVVNFGANIGEVALGLANVGARVIAVEPDPNVLPALRVNAFGRNIEVLAAAAWSCNDYLDLYQATTFADSSVIDKVGPAIEVRAYAIDTMLCNHLGTVHLILGDAEGAEPEVLQGAAETLKRTRYVAIRTGAERHGKSSAPLCVPILEAAGFEILTTEQETVVGRNKALV